MTFAELKKVNRKAVEAVPKEYIDLGSNLDFYMDDDVILMVYLSCKDLPTLAFNSHTMQYDRMCRITDESCSQDCPGLPTPCPECCKWMVAEVTRLQAVEKYINELLDELLADFWQGYL